MTMDTNNPNLNIPFFCRNARLSLQKAAFARKSHQLSEELEHLRNFEMAVSRAIQGRGLYQAKKVEKEILELEFYLPDVSKRLAELEGKHPFLARHMNHKVLNGGGNRATNSKKWEKAADLQKNSTKKMIKAPSNSTISSPRHHHTSTLISSRPPSSSSAASSSRSRPPDRTSSAPPLPSSTMDSRPSCTATTRSISPFVLAKNPPLPHSPPSLHRSRSCSPSARSLSTSPESISFRKFKQSAPQKKKTPRFRPPSSSPSPPSPSPSTPLPRRNTIAGNPSTDPSPSSSKASHARKVSKNFADVPPARLHPHCSIPAVVDARPPSVMKNENPFPMSSRLDDGETNTLNKPEFLLLDTDDEDRGVRFRTSVRETCAYELRVPASKTPPSSSSDGDYLSWRTKHGLMKMDERGMSRDASANGGHRPESENSDTGSIGYRKDLQRRQSVLQDEEGIFHIPVDDFSEEKYRMMLSEAASPHQYNDYSRAQSSPYLQTQTKSSTPSSYSWSKEAENHEKGATNASIGDGFQELETALEQFHFGETSHCSTDEPIKRTRRNGSRDHKQLPKTGLMSTENLEEALRRLRRLQESNGSFYDGERDSEELLDEAGNLRTRSIAGVPSSIVDQLLNDDMAHGGKTASASSSAACANSKRTLFGEQHRNESLASGSDYREPGDGTVQEEESKFNSFSDEKSWERSKRWNIHYEHNDREEDDDVEGNPACKRGMLRGSTVEEIDTQKGKKKKKKDKTVKFESWNDEGGTMELATDDDDDGDGDENVAAPLFNGQVQEAAAAAAEGGGLLHSRSSSLGTGDDDDAVSRLRKLQVKRFMGEDECAQHEKEEEKGGDGDGQDVSIKGGLHRKSGFTMPASSFTKADALSSSSSSSSSSASSPPSLNCTQSFRNLRCGSGRVSPAVAFWDHYNSFEPHLRYLSSDAELYQQHHEMGAPNIPQEATFCNPVFDFDSTLSSKAFSESISRQMFGLCDADGDASSPLQNGGALKSAVPVGLSNFLSQEHLQSIMSKLQADLKEQVEEAVAESMKKFEASLKIDSELKRLQELGNQIQTEIKASLHEGRGHSSQRKERELEAIAVCNLEKRLSQFKDTISLVEKDKAFAEMKSELFSMRKESEALKTEVQGSMENMNHLVEEIRSRLEKEDKRYRDVKDSIKEQMLTFRKDGMECRYLLDGMKKDTDEQMHSIRRAIDELNAQGVQKCKVEMQNFEKLLHEEQLNSKHIMESLEQSWKQWQSDIDALKQFRDAMEGETGALRCDTLLRNLVQNLVDSWKEDHSEFETLKRFKDDVENGRMVSKSEMELKNRVEKLERATNEEYGVLRESLRKLKDELEDGKNRVAKSEVDWKSVAQSLESSWMVGYAELEDLKKFKKDLEDGRSVLKSEAEIKDAIKDLRRSWEEGCCDLRALKKFKKDLEEGSSVLKSEAEMRIVVQDLQRSWKEGCCDLEALKKFKKDLEDGRIVVQREAAARDQGSLIMERVEGLSQLYLGGLDEVRREVEDIKTQFHYKLDELIAKQCEDSTQKISLLSLENRVFELEKGHSCAQILQEKVHDILSDAGKHSKSAAASARAAEDSLATLSDLISSEMNNRREKISKLEDDLVSDRETTSCLLLELRNMNADALKEKEASLAAAATAKKKIQEVMQDFETELVRLRIVQSKADKERDAIATLSEEISGSAAKARNMMLELSEVRQKSVQISDELQSELNQTKWKNASASHRYEDVYKKVLNLEGSQLDLSRKLEEFSDKTEELERSVAEWVPKYDAAARVLNEVENRLGMLEASGRNEMDTEKRLAELDDKDAFLRFSTSGNAEALRWSPLDAKRNLSSLETREKGKTLDTRIIILESRIEHVASATYTNLRILDTKVEHINGNIEKAIRYATVAEKKCNILGAELVKVFRMLAKSSKSNPEKLCRSPSVGADSHHIPKAETFRIRRKSPLSTAPSNLKKHIATTGDIRTSDLRDARISARNDAGMDDKESATNRNGSVGSSSRGKSQNMENDNKTRSAESTSQADPLTASKKGVDAGSKNAYSVFRCNFETADTEDGCPTSEANSTKLRTGDSSDRLDQDPTKLQKDTVAASNSNNHASPGIKTRKADFHLDSGKISVNVSHRSRLFK